MKKPVTNISTILVVLILFIVSSKTIFGQDVDVDFKIALDLYNSNQFSDASIIFENIAYKNDFNGKTTAAHFLLANCKIKSGDFPSAEKILNDFLVNHETSKYFQQVIISLAFVKYKQEDFQAGVKLLLDLYSSAANITIKQNCKNGLELFTSIMNETALKEIIYLYSEHELTPFLYLNLGLNQYYSGSQSEAEKTFFYIIENYPGAEEHAKAVDYYQKKMSDSDDTPKIVVLLPFITKGSETFPASLEVLEGIKYALDQYNIKHSAKIGLLIKDTQRSEVRVAEIAKELKTLKNVLLVIGSIYSDDTKFICEQLRDTEIPIFSPTATDNDITQIYPNFFQANPSFDLRGRIMAQYAYFVVMKRNMGIIFSNEGYSQQLASSFKNEFEKLGGKILLNSSYSLQTLNLSGAMNQLRKDVKNLDGIYLPISDSKAIPALTTLFLTDSIIIDLYGNQDWVTMKGLGTSSILSNNLTISTDYFLDYRDDDFISEGNKFLSKTNSELTKNVLYGYDLMTFLLGVFEKQATLDNKLNNSDFMNLHSIGYHNSIFFNDERVNCFLNLVRYKSGIYELVDKFKYEK